MKEIKETLEQIPHLKFGAMGDKHLTIYTPAWLGITINKRGNYNIKNVENKIVLQDADEEQLLRYIRVAIAQEYSEYVFCIGLYGCSHELTDEAEITAYKEDLDRYKELGYLCSKCRKAQAEEFAEQEFDSEQWTAFGNGLPVVDDLHLQKQINETHRRGL